MSVSTQGLTGSAYASVPIRTPSATPLIYSGGFAAPVNGWGLAGSPYGGIGQSPDIFVIQGGPVDEPLGFSYEKIEIGPPNRFSWGVRVAEVTPGSWAEQNGIEVGQMILRFNDEDVSLMSTAEFRDMLQQVRPFSLVLQIPGFRSLDNAELTLGAQARFSEDSFADAEKALEIPEDNAPEYAPPRKPFFSKPRDTVDRMFPIGFLLFCAAMFVIPIMLMLYIGADTTAQHWLPHITHFVLLLPLFYIITFVAHSVKGAPSKFFVTLSLFGSAVMLLLISSTLSLQAYTLGPMFASTSDCMTWTVKKQLQDQWDAASIYYAKCMKQIASNTSQPFEAIVNDLRIQDCPSYANVSAQHPDWKYLKYLEVDQQCSGFCKQAPPLWTKQRVQDACGPVVAGLINDRIDWGLKQVAIYSVFALLAIAVIMMNITAFLRKLGIDW